MYDGIFTHGIPRRNPFSLNHLSIAATLQIIKSLEDINILHTDGYIPKALQEELSLYIVISCIPPYVACDNLLPDLEPM